MHTGSGTENRHSYQKQTNFRTGSGSCFDLKPGSPMFRMFRKPVSVLDDKNNKSFSGLNFCIRTSVLPRFIFDIGILQPFLHLFCVQYLFEGFTIVDF
jgi:hypothetical protein